MLSMNCLLVQEKWSGKREKVRTTAQSPCRENLSNSNYDNNKEIEDNLGDFSPSQFMCHQLSVSLGLRKAKGILPMMSAKHRYFLKLCCSVQGGL